MGEETEAKAEKPAEKPAKEEPAIRKEFAHYVSKHVKAREPKNPETAVMWLGIGKYSDEAWLEILDFLGTRSTAEVTQIVRGVLTDLALGKKRLVATKK